MPDLEEEDDPISDAVLRLSRPHPSGGRVIERAAILAEGADSAAILRWIEAHGGEPEHGAGAASTGGGLHGERRRSERAATQLPLRYVVPPQP